MWKDSESHWALVLATISNEKFDTWDRYRAGKVAQFILKKQAEAKNMIQKLYRNANAVHSKDDF